MAKTAAQKNREIRQNALRDQLRSQQHLTYVVDNIGKIEQLASVGDQEGANVRAIQSSGLKTATEMRLRLIDKYLPSPKAESLPVEFDFDRSSPAAQVASVMTAASEGRISPDVAQMFASAIKSACDIEAATELKARIEKLEAMLDAKSG
jgi:hypothetical protein